MNILLGKQIAMLRKRNNMTQAELAEKLSISYQAISQWEHSNTYPDITILPEIAKYLTYLLIIYLELQVVIIMKIITSFYLMK